MYLDYSRATFIFHSRPLRTGVILIGELSSHFPIWWLLFFLDGYTSKRWVLRSSNTWLPRPWLRPRPFPYKTPIYLPLPCFSRACFIYSGFISIKMYAQMESLPVAFSNYLSFKGYRIKHKNCDEASTQGLTPQKWHFWSKITNSVNYFLSKEDCLKKISENVCVFSIKKGACEKS